MLSNQPTGFKDSRFVPRALLPNNRQAMRQPLIQIFLCHPEESSPEPGERGDLIRRLPFR